MTSIYQSKHLSKKEQVQLGSYYTPKELVDKVYENIKPYIAQHKNTNVIFDNAAGSGAFIVKIPNFNYRASDCDQQAYDSLQKYLNKKNIFCTNSLVDVHREKYNIPKQSFLIMIGNPPYNDTTSEFRKGKKGKNLCDRDLFDRDLGVSFLKSYDKLKADVICVLHPLSYLIKKTNFNRLKSFKDNYTLKKGIVFPSSWFAKTGSTKFPIMIALYEKSKNGMDFDYIKNFQFSILNTEKTFTLSLHKTTDGFIDKYPPRKNDPKISPLGLYYYTFRDLNSLRRNASFLNKPHYNGIVVTVDNFYKYAYLYTLKSLFQNNNLWLYGNISPLIDMQDLEKNKKLYVEYALKTNKTMGALDKETLHKITNYYKIRDKNLLKLRKIEKIKKSLSVLTQKQQLEYSQSQFSYF